MKIAIIGAGNLGSALISGLQGSGIATDDILVFEQAEKAKEVNIIHGVNTTTDLSRAFDFGDIVFLGLKGYVFGDLAKRLGVGSASGKSIVSFMAGVTLDTLKAQLANAIDDTTKFVRAMPSLSIATRDGVVGYTAAPPEVELLLYGLGFAFEVEPDDIDKVTAFASCGLGFASYLVDAFAKAGEAMGFSQQSARSIAARTFKNALERTDFAETVKQVSTRGGATEQGILHFDENDVYGIVNGAVQKAYNHIK